MRRKGIVAACLLVLVLWGCEAAAGKPTPAAGKPTPAGGKTPSARPGAEAKPTLAQAEQEFLAGNYLRAHDLFAQVWRKEADNFAAVDGLVRCSEMMGETRALVEQLYSQSRSSPPAAAREYALGLTELFESKFEQALGHLNAALALAPDNPWVLYARGELFRAVGSDAEAEDDLRAVLRRNPNHGPALAGLAMLAYRRDQKTTEAVSLLEQALPKFRPVERSQQVAAYIFLGRLYGGEGRNDDAVKQFRAARQLDVAGTYALVNLGSFLTDHGRTQEAETEWDSTVRELGADSPTGLDILRTRRQRAGDLVDLTHLLGLASDADYQTLLAHVGSPRRLATRTIDEVLQPFIPLLREVFFDSGEDLDGDGQRERLILDAVQSNQAFPDQFLVTDAVLRIFSADGSDPYILPTHFEHFLKLLVRDLDGDGRKEVLLVGIRETNKLTVAVVAKLPVGYGLVLTVSVVASTPWAGCLISDLDGDGAREMLFISGEEGWVDLYRWRASRPTLADADFPQFYQAFLTRWSAASPEELARLPQVVEKLRQARAFRRQGSR
jgi:tetratricopeptide (TPR) repeat protein